HDRPMLELPARVRQQVISQALARVIAHEVGHYLLRSSTHAPTGLMRGGLTVSDIIDRGTINTRLRPSEAERLRRRFAPCVLDTSTASPSEERTSPFHG